MAAVMMDILVEGEKVLDCDERFLHVVQPHSREQGLASSASAPHSRSSSFKNRPRPKLSLDVEAAQRPRTNSLPTNQLFLSLPNPDWMTVAAPKDTGGVCRVRSFKTTSKGIVNRGDSFKRSTHSLASNGSIGSLDPECQGHHGSQGHIAGSRQSSPSASPRAAAARRTGGGTRQGLNRSLNSLDSGGAPSHSDAASMCPSYYKVLMMGATGSGKSALTRQFMTSEYKGTYEISTPDVETDGMSVSVLLDGEESMMEFIDEERHPDVEGEDITVDAYVVVFSVADTASYNYAVDTVRRLRVDCGTDRAIILVGNKIDLARQRRVTKHDATKLATKYDCRYTETSAALNHHVDELLVGCLSQIRLKLHPPDPVRPPAA
ncbi:uncharacterized protein LOC143285439 [Babylonia areolata]|uniref:uncharacterized protein LOC143285439 n=1 Tax=Babylonia areolata TaxID=304850 RepID=UPI003FD2D399